MQNPCSKNCPPYTCIIIIMVFCCGSPDGKSVDVLLSMSMQHITYYVLD